MSRLFANGTEGGAWEAVWCQLCTHDTNNDCSIHTALYCEPDDVPIEIVEQPEGEFHLPPLHVCTTFAPIDGYDPQAEVRARVIAHVAAAPSRLQENQ